MKYLQFNRETEQTESESRSARIHQPTRPSEATQTPPTKLTPARDRRRGAALGRLEMQRNCWFGHTTSSTPHLIPIAVKSLVRQPQVPRWETTREPVVLNVFFFSRRRFSPSRQRGVPGRACSFPQRRAVGRRRGPESEERRAIRPWQKARGNELVWCSQQMSEHRASPSSLAEQAATDSDILCALVKQNKYNTAYNNYQCRNLESVTTIQVIFVQISIQHCCSCWNRPSK
ncbi:Hypothetical_protein [Hexamita inflata]|uniref:Hypothetical_protein n=1 Tax=Hexamita inflata TaxID=28002 RepID=A0AA86RH10_9EUKA|nr:Hypothetical protein HINF_LOCUS65959 [Hexamita inflata]